jgi:hypothetical protein
LLSLAAAGAALQQQRVRSTAGQQQYTFRAEQQQQPPRPACTPSLSHPASFAVPGVLQPIVVEKGLGAWVWDTKGDKYLDMTTGVCSCVLRHMIKEMAQHWQHVFAHVRKAAVRLGCLRWKISQGWKSSQSSGLRHGFAHHTVTLCYQGEQDVSTHSACAPDLHVPLTLQASVPPPPGTATPTWSRQCRSRRARLCTPSKMCWRDTSSG